MARALAFVGLVCLAFTAAGAASVASEADNEAVTGRQLLTQGYWAWFPDQTQVQYQSAGNYAGNNGPAYQQAVNQGNQQQGYGNTAGNFNSQSFQFGPPGKDGKDGKAPGRKLLGNWGWVPDQTQVQYQSAGNYAGNNGAAYQQAVNQGNQQQGYGNTAGNFNSQSFQFGPPDPAAGKPGKDGKDGKDGKAPGRKLLGNWGWFPDQAQIQYQSAGNTAQNNGAAYQQAVNQGNQQQGGWNQAINANSQSFNFGPPGKDGKDGKDGKAPGRKLLGYWGWVPSQTQVQYQSAGNNAGNNGAAYQQAVNQGNQQQGSWNTAGNFNSQSFQFPADPAAGKPGKDGKAP